MGLFRRLRDALGLNEEYDEYYYSDEDTSPDNTYADNTYSNNTYPNNGYMEDNQPLRRKVLPNNVIGMPGLMMEVILMQPRSFEEIPDAVTALRERKAVILNLNYMEVDQAQRCADYVAGGAFAIDGHQRQIGENVFLFTPNFVQISNHQTVNPPVNPPVVPPSPPFETPPSPWARQSPFEPHREF